MTAPALHFDPAAHRYTLNGVELPSVTTILRAVGLIDDTWFTPESQERGTVVHECCEILNRGLALDDNTVDDVVRPYVDGYRKFLSDMGRRIEIHHVEERVYHARHKYAGTLDIRGTIDRFPFIADIKTGDFAPWHAIQLALYQKAVSQVGKRFAVYLTSGGSYSLKVYDDPSDIDVGLSAVALYHWRKKHGC